MKTINYKIQSLLLGLVLCLGFVACEEQPDAFKQTSGIPEVTFVRLPSVAAADSLLDGAFLGEIICIVGNNLRSVHELYFNDQKAILNTSLMTNNTLIVGVPRGIPEDVTDNMYLITKSGEQIAFPFRSIVPPPVVSAISCEYAHDGKDAILYGDFFIDDPNIPLTITMAGNVPVTEIKEITKTTIRFVVPEGSQKGFINVESLYGMGRSHFQFRDDRGMILDFDGLNPNGWRAGRIAEEGGISGRYGFFKGDIADDVWFDGDDKTGFELDVWSREPKGPYTNGDWFDATNLDNLICKFEVNVLQPWSALALQLIFQPWSEFNNTFFQGSDVSRGLWIPWATTGSFITDGWITVSIPMTEFNRDADGKVIERMREGNYGGLTLFVWKGGIPGTPCTTEIWIDNVRVVPVE